MVETLNKIVVILKEKSIEQKALTDYLGITAQVFTDWKGGRNSSYVKYIDKIADFLNVSTDYLLGKDDIKKRPTSEDAELINNMMKDSNTFKEFAKDYLSLSPEGQKKLQEFARFLIHSDDGKDD